MGRPAKPDLERQPGLVCREPCISPPVWLSEVLENALALSFVYIN